MNCYRLSNITPGKKIFYGCKKAHVRGCPNYKVTLKDKLCDIYQFFITLPERKIEDIRQWWYRKTMYW